MVFVLVRVGRWIAVLQLVEFLERQDVRSYVVELVV